MLLSPFTKFAFYKFISFLCATKLIPYQWNKKQHLLKPASRLGVFVFHIHSWITFILAILINFRVARAYMSTEKNFALMQKVFGVFGAACHAITALGFAQLELQMVEVMQVCNRILYNLEKELDVAGRNSKKYSSDEISNYRKHRHSMTKHMVIGLFVLATNIPVHVMIPAASPCAPHFLTSMYFECKTYEENIVPPDELFPFLFPEFYTMVKFLIINCFYWTFLMMGLGVINFQLQGLQLQNHNGYAAQMVRLKMYRSIKLFCQMLNRSFFYYLSFFSHILFFILSLLLFGTIRLWRIDPRASLSLPMCGLRCGYEVFSPVIAAGQVDKSNGDVMSELETSANRFIVRQKGVRSKHKDLVKILKSCAPVQCTAGTFFTFENFLVISSLDGCIETTFDLLVTFKDEKV